MKKNPTEMQRKAALDTLANSGRDKPKTKKQIMLDAGFSPAMAKNPHIVEQSRGFRELLEAAVPDDELMRVAQEGLRATTLRFSPEGDQLEVDDYATRHKYWKDLHLIKGHLKTEQTSGATYNQFNIFNNPEIKGSVSEFEEDLKKKLGYSA